MEIYKIEVFSIVIFEFKIRIICWVTFIVHVIFILINYLCMATFGKLNFLWSITLRRIGSILRVTPIPGKIITGTLLTVLGLSLSWYFSLFWPDLQMGCLCLRPYKTGTWSVLFEFRLERIFHEPVTSFVCLGRPRPDSVSKQSEGYFQKFNFSVASEVLD